MVHIRLPVSITPSALLLFYCLALASFTLSLMSLFDTSIKTGFSGTIILLRSNTVKKGKKGKESKKVSFSVWLLTLAAGFDRRISIGLIGSKRRLIGPSFEKSFKLGKILHVYKFFQHFYLDCRSILQSLPTGAVTILDFSYHGYCGHKNSRYRYIMVFIEILGGGGGGWVSVKLFFILFSFSFSPNEHKCTDKPTRLWLSLSSLELLWNNKREINGAIPVGSSHHRCSGPKYCQVQQYDE